VEKAGGEQRKIHEAREEKAFHQESFYFYQTKGRNDVGECAGGAFRAVSDRRKKRGEYKGAGCPQQSDIF
jgi:hypothetical protein